MRLNTGGSWILVLVTLLTASGCEGNRPLAPSPPAPSPPTVVGMPEAVAVRVEGVVIDADTEQAVSDATVTVVHIRDLHRPLPRPAPSAISDSNGRFVLTASFSMGWSEMALGVQRDGYESPVAIYLDPNAAVNTLRVYPTITIRPGESIDTKISLGSYVCGWESARCRRIMVPSFGDEAVNLNLIPLDGQKEIGLFTGDPGTWPYDFRHNVQTSKGEVWIIGAQGRVTVTARRE
jgi:hypothetical protein